MRRIASAASFGGQQETWEHDSATLGVPMRFAVYRPPQAAAGPRPALWFLSGLTCTEQNVVTKGAFQAHCAAHGLLLVCPDTSPRGAEVPDDDAWDLGQGAGFYVDATEAPWRTHYRMQRYLREELRGLIETHLPCDGRHALTGHSMGGHGALVLGLRDPDRYASISAFAPIVAPSDVPWGQKAFSAYLGDDRAAWAAHDATALVRHRTHPRSILIDQGTADGFLEAQLQPQRFVDACEAAGQPVELRMQRDYDHSYFFVASFAADHVAHAARAFAAQPG